jgi:hypothetical protein
MKARLHGHRLSSLSEAIEASWDAQTAYRGHIEPGNPAFGQCYPTSWLVQQFNPAWEIVRGAVITPTAVHTHFWNAQPGPDGMLCHLDLTSAQFAPGARVQGFEILDRRHLGDSAATVARCQLLLDRVTHRLTTQREPQEDLHQARSLGPPARARPQGRFTRRAAQPSASGY